MTESDRAAFYGAEEELHNLKFTGDFDELEILFLDNADKGTRYLSAHSELSIEAAHDLLCRVYG